MSTYTQCDALPPPPHLHDPLPLGLLLPATRQSKRQVHAKKTKSVKCLQPDCTQPVADSSVCSTIASFSFYVSEVYSDRTKTNAKAIRSSKQILLLFEYQTTEYQTTSWLYHFKAMSPVLIWIYLQGQFILWENEWRRWKSTSIPIAYLTSGLIHTVSSKTGDGALWALYPVFLSNLFGCLCSNTFSKKFHSFTKLVLDLADLFDENWPLNL